jgi:DNA processing protein
MQLLNDEARFWLALRMVRGVGCVLYQSLLRAFGNPRAAMAASTHALKCAGVRADVAQAIRAFDDWSEVDRQLQLAERHDVCLITWADENYPEGLHHIHDPPPFLFTKGAILRQDRLAVAIVGSRDASSYGLKITREIAEGLARTGVTVVSGLARGIDAEAHHAALSAQGRSLAVLGSGIDVVYPSEHHHLFMRIVEQGAGVSEFFMGTKPDAENFPSRNRIISGLALGTVVVEATEKSGSLITAQAAADQGREVFAVPGPVGARSRGTHRLIRDGAKLTERVEDVLEEIAPRLLLRPSSLTAEVALERSEERVVASLGDETRHVDDLIGRSGLATSQVLDALLTLELKGVVQQLPGKFYTLRGAGLGATR